jgi:hypothetical protein
LCHEGAQKSSQRPHVVENSVRPTDVELPHFVAAFMSHVAVDVICAFVVQPYDVPSPVLQL